MAHYHLETGPFEDGPDGVKQVGPPDLVSLPLGFFDSLTEFIRHADVPGRYARMVECQECSSMTTQPSEPTS